MKKSLRTLFFSLCSAALVCPAAHAQSVVAIPTAPKAPHVQSAVEREMVEVSKKLGNGSTAIISFGISRRGEEVRYNGTGDLRLTSKQTGTRKRHILSDGVTGQLIDIDPISGEKTAAIVHVVANDDSMRTFLCTDAAVYPGPLSGCTEVPAPTSSDDVREEERVKAGILRLGDEIAIEANTFVQKIFAPANIFAPTDMAPLDEKAQRDVYRPVFDSVQRLMGQKTNTLHQ